MKRLYWLVPTYGPEQSYYRLSAHMRAALERRGLEVVFLPPDLFEMPGDVVAGLCPDIGAGNTVAAGPSRFLKLKVGKAWAFTMWESTRLPPETVETVEAHCERVIVPCDWVAGVFRRGLKPNNHIPQENVHVVQLGIDPYEFPVIERPERDTFTFLAFGDRGSRKGWDLVLPAFYKAFGAPGDSDYAPDVRLIFKVIEPRSSLLHRITHITDRRVRIWRENAPRMADVYRQADCLVFPSRSEGWGLPPREAAATGLPVICTDYSGMAGDVKHWGIPLTDFIEVDASDMYLGHGKWAQPGVSQIAEQMRWVYAHRGEARAIGMQGAAWLREHQTWDHSAAAFIKLMEEVNGGKNNGGQRA